MEDKLMGLETDVLAKEKGYFLETCRCGGYPDCICTDKYTTQALLQRWLREKHDINLTIFPNHCRITLNIESYTVICYNKYGGEEFNYEFNTYEKALEYGLLETLKLI